MIHRVVMSGRITVLCITGQHIMGLRITVLRTVRLIVE